LAASGAIREWLITHFLQGIEYMAAIPALIFINWHRSLHKPPALARLGALFKETRPKNQGIKRWLPSNEANERA
jgi:hypothetical protein